MGLRELLPHRAFRRQDRTRSPPASDRGVDPVSSESASAADGSGNRGRDRILLAIKDFGHGETLHSALSVRELDGRIFASYVVGQRQRRQVGSPVKTGLERYRDELNHGRVEVVRGFKWKMCLLIKCCRTTDPFIAKTTQSDKGCQELSGDERHEKALAMSGNQIDEFR